MLALCDNKPPIASIRKNEENGEAVVASSIIILITDSIKLVNVTNNMNEYQIRFVTRQIMDKYYFLKIDEIRNCLESGITGAYGIIYNRVDVAVILEWFEKYMTLRDSACEMIRNDEVGNNNIYQLYQNDGANENALVKAWRYVKEGLDENGKPIPGKRKSTLMPENKTHPVINDDEKRFSDWVFDRWDERLRKQSFELYEKGLIFYKGIKMDYTSFAELKYMQRLIVQTEIMKKIGLL